MLIRDDTVRGGGMAHPIRPRNWAQALPRKVRALGMRIALSSKLSMGLLRVVYDLDEGRWKKTGEANMALCDGWVNRITEVDDAEVNDLDPMLETETVLETASEAAEAAATEAAAEEATKMAPDTTAGTAEQAAEAAAAAATAEEAMKTAPETVTGTAAEAGSETATQAFAGEAPTDPALQPELGDLANETPSEQAVEIANDEPEWVTRFGRDKNLSILFLHAPDKSPEKLWPFARVLRNIPGIEIMSTTEVEVYHVLKFQWLVMEGSAVDAIVQGKGHRPVGQLELDGPIADPEAETLASSVPLEDDRKKKKLPSSWDIYGWRHDTGAKSTRKVFGSKNAKVMEDQAKKARKVAKRLVKQNLVQDLVQA